MTGMETAYLVLVIASMLAFCLGLAWAIVTNKTER